MVAMESANLAMADMSLLHMVDPRVEDMVCNICILPKGGHGWGGVPKLYKKVVTYL